MASGIAMFTFRQPAHTVALSDQAIREILVHRIDVEKGATGMAVGVVDHGRRRVITYGHLDGGNSPSVDAKTLFEIGSITKVFTALLLADMARRNELDFNDPVDRYLPTGFRMPQRNGGSITLADLATHTAGFPNFLHLFKAIRLREIVPKTFARGSQISPLHAIAALNGNTPASATLCLGWR